MISVFLDSPIVRYELASPGTELYGRAATLAQLVYRRTYAATIDPRPHTFLACVDNESAEVTACAGLVFAQRDTLFSESYLDCSLEEALRGVFEQFVERRQVVEVTSLATKTPMLGSELVRILPILLWFMGHKAVVCTITEKLQHMFRNHGLPFTVLARADRARVPSRPGVDWGSYYDSNPHTCVVRLDQIGHLFQTNCGRYSLGPSEGRDGSPYAVSP